MIMTDLGWGDPVKGWKLSLSLDRKDFLAGEPVMATMVFRNVSSREQTLGGHGADFDYVLNCQTDYGEAIPLTLFGKRMLAGRDLVKTTGGTLKPNEDIVVEVVVSRHLDLSLSGKYRLSASRRALVDEEGEPFVISNSVEFAIEDR
jgi:hypothetical protein